MPNPEPSVPKKIIMDISHVGIASPSENSKSVLVTSRQMIENPIDSKSSVEKNELPSHDVPSIEKPKHEIKTLENHPEVKPKSEETESKPQPDSDKSEQKDEKVADVPVPAGKTEELDIAKAEEAQKTQHDAEIAEIVNAKTYYLPINTVENRKSKRFIALGIIFSVVLLLVWANLALDAGIIKIGGIKALTEFY